MPSGKVLIICVVISFALLHGAFSYFVYEYRSLQQTIVKVKRKQGEASRSARSTPTHADAHSVGGQKSGNLRTPPQLLPGAPGTDKPAIPAYKTGVGFFKFANDPVFCRYGKWKWCYLPGNTDFLRSVFMSEAVQMQEVPALPLDSEGGGAWQLKWELADEADGHFYGHYRTLHVDQKINHCPDVRELGNKRYLQANMGMALDHFGDEQYNFFPRSYAIPRDIGKFQRAHMDRMRVLGLPKVPQNLVEGSIAHKAPLYIIKLAATDRGEGIRVVRGPEELGPLDKGIVQSYVQYPYLLNGFKFTIRLYAVYTSLDPIRLYVYPEGFIHMATEKYNPDPSTIKNRYMHLTNPDISKARPFYAKNPRPFYWSISEMRKYMRDRGDDDDVLWDRIGDVVRKTVLAAEPKLVAKAQQVLPYRGNCFELIGLDILVDENLQPWLLEVNPDPDMTAHKGFQLAFDIKTRMLQDLLHMLSLDPSGRGNDLQSARQSAAAALLALGSGDDDKLSTSNAASELELFLGEFSHLSVNGDGVCSLKEILQECAVHDLSHAMMLVDTQLEWMRRKSWQRLLPAANSSLLEWFYAAGDADQLLQCWEKRVLPCRQHSRAA